MTDEDRQRLVAVAPDFGIRLLQPGAPQDQVVERCQTRPKLMDVLGARIEVLARLGDDDADLVLLRESWPSGRSLPLHNHVDPKSLFVLSGELEIYCHGSAGSWQKVGPEEAFHIPPDARHAVRNSGTATAKLLTVTTVRMLRFLESIGTKTSNAEPQQTGPQELAAFVGRMTAYEYGLIIH